MSQIASAYVVSSELLTRLERLSLARDVNGFWQSLHTSAAKVQPEFSYAGYVLTVVLVFLEEQGVSLPFQLQDMSAKAALEEYGLALCAGQHDAPSLVASLDAHTASDTELRQFFEEFSGEEWDEAGAAMQEGFAFLRRAFLQLREVGGWFLLFIG